MQNQVENTDALLDIGQVAQLLGTSHFYVQAHSSGKNKPSIAYLKLGHRMLRFRRSDVEDFIQARQSKKV
jgi:predicted DNA-binding transcriptional regulator AlpA